MDSTMDRMTAIKTLLALVAGSVSTLAGRTEAAPHPPPSRPTVPVPMALYGMPLRAVTEVLLSGQVSADGVAEARALSALAEEAVQLMSTPAGRQYARRIGFDLSRLPVIAAALDDLNEALVLYDTQPQ